MQPPRCCCWWQGSLLTVAPPPPPRPCPLSAAATVCRVLCTRVHASCMHTRVCRATACCTERSRPALGPYTLLCMYMQSINLHSINPSVSRSCKMQSFPSARSRLSPRMHPTSSLSLSKNRPPWSSGVQYGSAAAAPSQHPLPPRKSDLSGFGPIMSSFPPNRHAASV